LLLRNEINSFFAFMRDFCFCLCNQYRAINRLREVQFIFEVDHKVKNKKKRLE
jgi:hypothetical protein